MKILVAVDTSSAGQTVLAAIAGRTWPVNSSFDVVSVVEPSHLWTTEDVAQEAGRHAADIVRRAVERLQAVKLNVTGLNVTGMVLTGDPKAILVDWARSNAADLVMLGPHGVSGGARSPLGNVAANVLRHAPCSVEIVREKLGEGSFRVLLATDASEHSERAAQSIADRPWPAGTEIRVLSAVELILPPVRAMFEPGILDSAFLEKARGEAMERAQKAIAWAEERLNDKGLNVSESISVLLDTPRAIILKEAEEWGAGLIVLGSHGHRGMVDRFLVGSTSETVAMQAACSVEVIR